MAVFTQQPEYSAYDVQRTRVRSEGVAPMAVSSDNETAPYYARLHSPMEFEVVTFFVARKGGAPVVPSPLPPDQNRKLICSNQTAGVPMRLSDGQYEYMVSGYYVYSIINPEGTTSAIKLGRIPWDKPVPPGVHTIPSWAISNENMAATE